MTEYHHMDFRHLGSLSRSGQTEFKDWKFQEKYYEFVCSQPDAADNKLLLLRKLRQGLVAVDRRDLFAVAVYKKSLDLAIESENVDEIGVSLSRLVELDTDYAELYQIHQVLTHKRVLHPATQLIKRLQRILYQLNYIAFYRLLDASSGYTRLLLALLTSRVRLFTLSVLTKSYLSLPIDVARSILHFESANELTCFLTSNHFHLAHDAKPFSRIRPLRALGILSVSYYFVHNCYSLVSIKGRSMQPTLNPDSNMLTSDHLILNKWLPYSHYKLGDIVALRPPDNPNKVAIKRIAGLWGDLVNGTYVDRGHCYVQGDESFHSIDSRQYGQVSLGTLIGKGVAIVYPLDRMQLL